METQKHTKGEWIYSKYQPYDFGVYSTEGKGNDIALVRGSDEEAEANAKLIAAAPELLDISLALWKALQQEMKHLPENRQQVLTELLGYAERTIRKATE